MNRAFFPKKNFYCLGNKHFQAFYLIVFTNFEFKIQPLPFIKCCLPFIKNIILQIRFWRRGSLPGVPWNREMGQPNLKQFFLNKMWILIWCKVIQSSVQQTANNIETTLLIDWRVEGKLWFIIWDHMYFYHIWPTNFYSRFTLKIEANCSQSNHKKKKYENKSIQQKFF